MAAVLMQIYLQKKEGLFFGSALERNETRSTASKIQGVAEWVLSLLDRTLKLLIQNCRSFVRVHKVFLLPMQNLIPAVVALQDT